MKKILTFLAVVALLAAPAMADYTPQDGWYKYVGTQTTMSGTVTGGGKTANVYWSLYNLQYGGNGDTKPAKAFEGTAVNGVSCIDFLQTAQTDYYKYEDKDLSEAPVGANQSVMSASQVAFLRELWTEQYSGLNTATGIYSIAEKKAAFQLAVWEIVYQDDVTIATTYNVRSDTSSDGKGLTTTANNDATTLANIWLRSLDDDNGNLEFYNVRALTSTQSQDWAFYSPDMGMIPAPGAVVLGMIGFGLVGWVKRRFA